MGMENGLKMDNTGGESGEGAVVGTTQWEDSEFSSDQTKTAVVRTEKPSLIQLLFLKQYRPDFTPYRKWRVRGRNWDVCWIFGLGTWVSSEGGHRRSKTGLKMINQLFMLDLVFLWLIQWIIFILIFILIELSYTIWSRAGGGQST